MHELRELSIPSFIYSLYTALGHISFLSLSFYLSLNLICSHPLSFFLQESISASHLHLLMQKEKRAFESQVADQVVKNQCLEAAAKEMKEEAAKMTARIQELKEEEIWRA